MSPIITNPLINVIEEDQENIYELFDAESGYVNYSREMYASEDGFVSDYLLLPIREEEYLNNRNTLYDGYRFIFRTHGTMTIYPFGLNDDANAMAVTLSIEKYHMMYYVDDDGNIVIAGTGDMFDPPAEVEAHGAIPTLHDFMLANIREELAQLDDFYMDKCI